jgi:hypothetical protein
VKPAIFWRPCLVAHHGLEAKRNDSAKADKVNAMQHTEFQAQYNHRESFSSTDGFVNPKIPTSNTRSRAYLYERFVK